MDRITFTVNETHYSVGPEIDSDVTLLDYVREYLELRGTKYMCREGGCGACVVAVTAPHPHTGVPRTFSINSCLSSITQCQDWKITTIEGIGNRLKGYHPVQRTLAEYNGSQCGYCSVGWVMAMYSLLESNNNDLTQYQIEDSFGSNNCRCTGYRPILDAFKSFAKDAPKPRDVLDIEDLNVCTSKDKNCTETCKDKSDWCWVNKEDTDPKGITKIKLKDNRVWYRVHEIKDIFDVLNEEGYDSYMLVAGNTGKGAYHIFEYPRVLIDIAPISELRKYIIDQNLILGAGTTLTDTMSIFRTLAQERPEFAYLQKLYDHLNLVAHIPVRNVGSIAGNLMVKHRVPDFSSDIYLLFEAVRATLTIVDRYDIISVATPEEFMNIDMTGKVIVEIKIPPLSENYNFVSFKTITRSQNVHATVNAAFLYHFDDDKQTVLAARIVMGGLSARFTHAKMTEEFLVGKNAFTNNVLQVALSILEKELIVEEIAGELSPEFRKKCALGLFYKAHLNFIPRHLLKPYYESGARDLRKTRPLSKAKDVYDTNPIIWPITEPMPKAEALIQCAGEAKYVNDLSKQPQEVFAAFVTSDIGIGDIVSMDPTPALKLPGVLAFFSAKDIPGKNNFMPTSKNETILEPEEILSSGNIKYYDQAIGIIVAETEILANRAALLVQVSYKDKGKPILTIQDARLSRDPNRVTFYRENAAVDRGKDVQKVIKGSANIFAQYHYSMETISCVARPNDDGVDVFPTTQYPDALQFAIAEALNIEENAIDMTVVRAGGAYGNKISRSVQINTACALVAYLMNRPCRMIMSIQSNMRIVGKRFPASVEFEVGVNNAGEIQYLDYNLYEDNGYVFSELIIGLALASVRSCYDNSRWNYRLYNVLTDTASNSWCRAPGSLESTAMTEYMMEQISYELGLDPLEVRVQNIDPQNTVIQEIVQKFTKDSEYYKRREEVKEFNRCNRWKKRGLGVSLKGYSSLILTNHQTLLAVYHGDGSVVVSHGGVEVGQGINTRVLQVVAYTLNIPMKKIKIKPLDMVRNPNTDVTGGSNGTQSVCVSVIKCCQLLLDRLAPIKAKMNDASWEDLIQAAYLAGINLQVSYHGTSNDKNIYRINGAALAEVELDILTGESHILRVDIVQDAGMSINPELDIGQVEGAFVMGIGYWTSEHLIYNQSTGELLTDRTWNYEIPMAKDIPIDFRVQLLRNAYNPNGVLGARAVHEAPICLSICVGFALRDAIVASREDTGYPRNKWFNVDGPYTIEANVLKADVHLQEFLYN